MNQEQLDSIRDARNRAEILLLVRRTHRAQASRMDHVEVWHMLRALGIELGEDDVLTFLQDLEGAELIEFEEEKDRRTNRVTITHIKLCNRGLRVLEGRVVEDIVLL